MMHAGELAFSTEREPHDITFRELITFTRDIYSRTTYRVWICSSYMSRASNWESSISSRDNLLMSATALNFMMHASHWRYTMPY